MREDAEFLPDDLRTKAEELLGSKSRGETERGERGEALREARNLIHDLRVHQIELELQNEELRETQQRLEEARDGYARLYNDAPVGYTSIDANGLILQANRTFLEMAGKEGTSLIGTALADLLASPDREIFLGRFSAFYKEPEGKDLEVRLAASVPPRWLRCTGRRESEVVFSGHRREGAPHLLLIVADVSETKAADDRIRQLLAEKELLLKETHHRIRNNMNSVYALLRLQSSRIADQVAVDALVQASDRVHGMMLIYEKLFQSDDFIHVPAGAYLSQLVQALDSSIKTNPSVALEVRAEAIDTDSRILFPIGIVVNELVTNAIKYAFPENRSGRILVEFTRHSIDRALLIVADDGVGIERGRPGHEDSSGFGITLVDSMVEQIDGKLERVQGPGTIWRVEFPLKTLYKGGG
ncbi:MAG: PAS domain S-box protein [Treponema sp.]|nr:PAS domain S-box protein [Treponema sp.]